MNKVERKAKLLENVKQKKLSFYFDGEYHDWYLFNSYREFMSYAECAGLLDEMDMPNYVSMSIDMKDVSYPQWISIGCKIEQEWDGDYEYVTTVITFDEIKKDFEELSDLLFNEDSYNKFIEEYRK